MPMGVGSIGEDRSEKNEKLKIKLKKNAHFLFSIFLKFHSYNHIHIEAKLP